MADACIICLGDLSELPTEISPPEDGALEVIDTDTDTTSIANPPPSSPISAPVIAAEDIARILPCHHHLHNDCLQPWIERANTCPVCRAVFNQVAIIKSIGGEEKSP